jgi:hypothetical protein
VAKRASVKGYMPFGKMLEKEDEFGVVCACIAIDLLYDK